MKDRVKLLVIGQGFVGLPLAMLAAQKGYDVVGFDTDSERVLQLRAGHSYVDDVDSAVLCDALKSKAYVPTGEITDGAGFHVAVICVPSPLSEGTPDLAPIEDAAAALGQLVTDGCCVILESTTYPGTTTGLVQPILEDASGRRAGVDFMLAYSPERIDPGNQEWTLSNTPKLVAGVNDASRDAAVAFYSAIIEKVVEVSGTAEAEMAKLLENSFRHVNIALLNELAVVAHTMGVDIWEVVTAAATKPFGFMSFQPGPGVGGHCIPVDPTFLSWAARKRTGSEVRLIEEANLANARMPDFVVRRVWIALNTMRKSISGSRILVLGIAYKRDSSDPRLSPALPIIEKLRELGGIISVSDPHVRTCEVVAADVRCVDATVEEVRSSDAVILLTNHSSFDLEALSTAARYFLDTRHCTTGPNVEYL